MDIISKVKVNSLPDVCWGLNSFDVHGSSQVVFDAFPWVRCHPTCFINASPLLADYAAPSVKILQTQEYHQKLPFLPATCRFKSRQMSFFFFFFFSSPAETNKHRSLKLGSCSVSMSRIFPRSDDVFLKKTLFNLSYSQWAVSFIRQGFWSM